MLCFPVIKVTLALHVSGLIFILVREKKRKPADRKLKSADKPFLVILLTG
jgi:hypothetical protein